MLISQTPSLFLIDVESAVEYSRLMLKRSLLRNASLSRESRVRCWEHRIHETCCHVFDLFVLVSFQIRAFPSRLNSESSAGGSRDTQPTLVYSSSLPQMSSSSASSVTSQPTHSTSSSPSECLGCPNLVCETKTDSPVFDPVVLPVSERVMPPDTELNSLLNSRKDAHLHLCSPKFREIQVRWKFPLFFIVPLSLFQFTTGTVSHRLILIVTFLLARVIQLSLDLDRETPPRSSSTHYHS